MNLIEIYQAKHENNELRLGKTIAPHRLHDHETHINTHLEEPNPSMELIKHVELHKIMLELEKV